MIDSIEAFTNRHATAIMVLAAAIAIGGIIVVVTSAAN